MCPWAHPITPSISYLKSGSSSFLIVLVQELLEKNNKVISLHKVLNECETVTLHWMIFTQKWFPFCLKRILLFYYNIECYVMLLNLWIATKHIKIISHKVTISLVINWLSDNEKLLYWNSMRHQSLTLSYNSI